MECHPDELRAGVCIDCWKKRAERLVETVDAFIQLSKTSKKPRKKRKRAVDWFGRIKNSGKAK